MIDAQMRAARAVSKLKLDEISKLSGVHRNTIAAIETGKSEKPNPRTVDALREAYRSVDVVFDDDGWPRKCVPESPNAH